ncbi:DNA-3-methyladenine glycosylase [Marinifilum sp. RC60d5]|uniref:DNA-3-methyladenine glycosylase n=1 Tax=Marinifilum sp. RC60d5 TaxID=3458414 RepID=UPI004036DC8D
MNVKIASEFYLRDVQIVAEELLGKLIVRKYEDGTIKKYRISEIEMYIGEEDLACHAAKGRTARTEIMYDQGGKIYMYLIYGMYWLLNIVTGLKDHPQAILIRGLQDISGPGRVGKVLHLDKSFYGEDLSVSDRIWLEDDGLNFGFTRHSRINIDYAGDIWKNKKYRYIIK